MDVYVFNRFDLFLSCISLNSGRQRVTGSQLASLVSGKLGTIGSHDCREYLFLLLAQGSAFLLLMLCQTFKQHYGDIHF